MSLLVLGVDGCKAGWCAVFANRVKNSWVISGPVVYRSFADLLALGAEAICIDVPIGLLDGPGQRECDVRARKLLGRPRGSSVFSPPCRAALGHHAHHDASEANRVVTRKGLSIQAFGILAKIAEVDSVMSSDVELQHRVREVHPEVCFHALGGARMISQGKKTLGGAIERWRVLRKVLPLLDEEPRLPATIRKECERDDYIDAAVAAWTAACITSGTAKCIPENPPEDAMGLRMEMWLPGLAASSRSERRRI